jgi:hypothetical protein
MKSLFKFMEGETIPKRGVGVALTTFVSYTSHLTYSHLVIIFCHSEAIVPCDSMSIIEVLLLFNDFDS